MASLRQNEFSLNFRSYSAVCFVLISKAIIQLRSCKVRWCSQIFKNKRALINAYILWVKEMERIDSCESMPLWTEKQFMRDGEMSWGEARQSWPCKAVSRELYQKWNGWDSTWHLDGMAEPKKGQTCATAFIPSQCFCRYTRHADDAV